MKTQITNNSLKLTIMTTIAKEVKFKGKPLSKMTYTEKRAACKELGGTGITNPIIKQMDEFLTSKLSKQEKSTEKVKTEKPHLEKYEKVDAPTLKKNEEVIVKSKELSTSQKQWLLKISGLSSNQINATLKVKNTSYILWTYNKPGRTRGQKAENKLIKILAN